MSHVLRARARTAAVTAAALLLAGVAAANPASAEVPEPGLHWGFRQSFRNYVGNPGNTTPQKIAPQSPAVFEGDGSALTRPYLFPVASGAATDAENFRVSFAGGVTYRYEAHTFTIDLSDLALVVEDGAAEVLADVRVQTTDTENFTPVAENDVVIATSSTVSAHLTATELTASVSGLEISAEGAAALQGFLSAGTELDDMTLRVGLEAGQVPWTPYLSVLGESIGTDATTIEVRGYGFEYGLKRASYIGNAVVGPYVRLGTLIGEWRPSQGAEGSTRTNVSQIWAVDETGMENPMVGGQGGVLFEEDGSFAGTLTGSAADFEGKAGFAGVYSYTTGPAVAAWESFTKVSVAGRTNELPSVALASSSLGDEGKALTLTASVSNSSSVRWERLAPGASAWEAVAGASSASLTLPSLSFAQNGARYRVVAENVVGTASATTTLKVKAAPTVKLSVASKVYFASKPKATVTVTAPQGVAANGKVTIKAGSTVVGTGTVTAGKASVALSTKLTPGSKTLVADFAGSADLTAAKSSTVKVSVAKAKAKVTAKFSKKNIKKSQRAKLKVSVKATGTKPAGTVKIVVKKGSKTVKTLKLKVKSGKTFSVKLPKLKKGKYAVTATFQGSKTVAKKSAKKLTLTVR